VAVLEANKTTNLTRIQDTDSAIRLHAIDSLACLREVLDAPPGRLLDVGSGAGFPGLPLAVVGNREAVLLDSVAKKTRIVQSIVEELGLSGSITCVAERAETHAESHRGEYAVVTARAVSSLAALVELAAPLLAPGGRLVCLKGRPSDQEIAAGETAASVCGMECSSIRVVLLPEGEESRTIVSYTVVDDARVALPRRLGLAQHRPLS
jgi:16S rRNA (guanine527-N7)-methyltransferase